jgi:hypothetical protein
MLFAVVAMTVEPNRAKPRHGRAISPADVRPLAGRLNPCFVTLAERHHFRRADESVELFEIKHPGAERLGRALLRQ